MFIKRIVQYRPGIKECAWLLYSPCSLLLCTSVEKLYFLYNMENYIICLGFLWRKHGESNYKNGYPLFIQRMQRPSGTCSDHV